MFGHNERGIFSCTDKFFVKLFDGTSLNHFHYARWLSVHIFDLMVLEIVHNDEFENFHLGHFCFKKTNRVFSMTALDQLHEQNNRTIKISMASNFANRADDSALIQWEICGVKISRIINEFEDTFRPEIENSSNHHKDSSSFARKFYREKKTLYEALPVIPFMFKNKMICKINNPSTDLPKDTYVTMSAMIKEDEKQFKSFINERLLYQKMSLSSGIHKNNFDPWHPRQTQLEKYCPLSSAVIKKIYSAISTGKTYQEPYLHLNFRMCHVA